MSFSKYQLVNDGIYTDTRWASGLSIIDANGVAVALAGTYECRVYPAAGGASILTMTEASGMIDGSQKAQGMLGFLVFPSQHQPAVAAGDYRLHLKRVDGAGDYWAAEGSLRVAAPGGRESHFRFESTSDGSTPLFYMVAISGPSGSNGVLSEEDVTKGQAALARLSSDQRGRKGFAIDFIAGGYAAWGDLPADHKLLKIENIPALTLTNATGGKRQTRKRIFENIGANALRLMHDVNGTPQGMLPEPAHSYLGKRTQPLVAQLDAMTGALVDAAAPSAAWSGNWIAFGDNTVLRQALYSHNATAGQDCYMHALVKMDDLSAPTTADLALYVAGSGGSFHPDTGAAGFKVTGPFQDSVYLIEAYRTAAATGATQSGIEKGLGASAKTFKIGFIGIGPGRYAPSLFDNATAVPNARAADVFTVPVAGFKSDALTFMCEFVAPRAAPAFRFLFSTNTGANRVEVYWSSSGTMSTTIAIISGGVLRGQLNVVVVPGTKYRIAIAVDKVAKTWQGKATGLAAVNVALAAGFAEYAPSAIMIGHQSGLYQLGAPISFFALLDRALTAAEIAAWVG